jgi:hypothetical protein
MRPRTSASITWTPSSRLRKRVAPPIARAMCWSIEMPPPQPAVGGPALRKLPIRMGRPVSNPPMPRVWCDPNPASASAMSTPPSTISFDRQGASGARMRPKVKSVSVVAVPRGRHSGPMVPLGV